MDKAILTQLRRHEDTLTALTKMIAQLRALVDEHGQAIANLEHVARSMAEPLTEDDGLGDLPARDRRALRAQERRPEKEGR